MHPIDDVDWASFAHAGPPDWDVAATLRALTAPGAHARAVALDTLDTHAVHQGARWPIAVPVAAALAHVAGIPKADGRAPALAYLATIAVGDATWALAHPSPRALVAGGGEVYLEAVWAQRDAVLARLADRSPAVRAAAAVVLAFFEDDAVAVALADRLRRETRDEVRASLVLALSAHARRASPLPAEVWALADAPDPLLSTCAKVAVALASPEEVPDAWIPAFAAALAPPTRDPLPWARGDRSALAAMAIDHLGPRAADPAVAALLAALPAAEDPYVCLALAGQLGRLVFPGAADGPVITREPPSALDARQREALTAIATWLDRPGEPTRGMPDRLTRAMRAHGLPESIRGLRGYLGLRRSGLEVPVWVRGEVVPLFLACKRVHLGTWPVDDVLAGVAAMTSLEDRAEICATFTPHGYELDNTGARRSYAELDVWWGEPLTRALVRPGLAPLLLARAQAVQRASSTNPSGMSRRVLDVLVHLGVPIDPVFDGFVAFYVRGILRCALEAPRRLLASLPADRREAIVLGLPAEPPRGIGPMGSGYAWDFADLAPTAPVLAHLEAGLASEDDVPTDVAALLDAVLSAVRAGLDAPAPR